MSRYAATYQTPRDHLATPGPELWAYMRKSGAKVCGVSYPYASRYFAQPETAQFTISVNDWGQVGIALRGPCNTTKRRGKTIVEAWRLALETIPADLFAWQPLLRDFGLDGTIWALHQLGRISAPTMAVAMAEMGA